MRMAGLVRVEKWDVMQSCISFWTSLSTTEACLPLISTSCVHAVHEHTCANWQYTFILLSSCKLLCPVTSWCCRRTYSCRCMNEMYPWAIGTSLYPTALTKDIDSLYQLAMASSICLTGSYDIGLLANLSYTPHSVVAIGRDLLVALSCTSA